MSQSSPTTPVVRGAQVTTEDGGRLNAFATEPRMEVVEATQGWGFHDRAEKLNGRMAMLGFIALLATELAWAANPSFTGCSAWADRLALDWDGWPDSLNGPFPSKHSCLGRWSHRRPYSSCSRPPRSARGPV